MSTLVISLTHGKGSGAEKVLGYLIEGIPVNSRKEICLLLADTSDLIEVAKSLGYEILIWKSKSNSLYHNLLEFIKFNKSQLITFKIIHAWHTRGFEWAYLLSKSDQELYGTLHDDPKSSSLSVFRKMIIKHFSRRLKALVVVSEALKNIALKNEYNNDVRVIKNGLHNNNQIQPNNQTGHLNVAFLGMNQTWKGISTIEKILEANLVKENVIFNLYGNCTESTVTYKNRLQNNYPARVSYNGHSTFQEIVKSNDLLFHPSLQFDPYPTALIEAAAFGLPAIASDQGGSSEIVEHNVTGYIFESDDYISAAKLINKLSESPSLIKQFSKSALIKYRDNFTIDTMVNSYLKLWNIN